MKIGENKGEIKLCTGGFERETVIKYEFLMYIAVTEEWMYCML